MSTQHVPEPAMAPGASAPAVAAAIAPERNQHLRRYLMCRPEHFTVRYRINPWMEPSRPTDTALAVRQWQTLYDTYIALGHEVELIDPLPGLPEMVYTANGGFVLDGIAYGPKFRHPERAAEAPAFMAWFAAQGFEVRAPLEVNEGEGDFLLAGETILAGSGFRSAGASHRELAEIFGREVVPLRLVDPRFYHLDTALAVLDPVVGFANGGPERAGIAYLAEAFDAESLAVLRARFPDAIVVSSADGAAFGLNAASDGKHVLVSPRASGFARQLEARGYTPVPVDLSELLLGGGGIKCCTLELRG